MSILLQEKYRFSNSMFNRIPIVCQQEQSLFAYLDLNIKILEESQL